MAPEAGAPNAGPHIETERRAREPLRTDIEGLRAIAVGAVILYHAHVGLFSGGYAGVDIFFVISGYLITKRLVRDADNGRGVSIRDFYARRVRRLLPMATVVMLATMVVAAVTQNRLEFLHTTLPDARAAAWFVSNISFARSGTTYLGEAGAESVFQQYWSLSAEEQFYVVWPLLMVVIVALATRTSSSIRAWCGGALAVLVVCSFALSVNGSRTDPVNAFFLLQYRAWELGIGALVAVGAATISRWIRPLRAAPILIGLAAIAVSIVAYSESTTWPGFPAAVPVLGTAMVIAAGVETRHGAASRFLALRPLQATGRYSYSLYLWHWPVIVLFVHPRGYSFPAVVVALVVTAGLSVASFRLIEDPVRNASWLRTRPNRCLGLGLLCILVVTVVSFALAPLFSLDTRRRSNAPPHVAGTPPAPLDFVPSDLVPSLEHGTSADDANADRNRTCHSLGQCSYGDQNSPTTVVLFGDSHGGHWTPALEVVARQKGWRLERLTHTGTQCNSLRPVGNCVDWVDETWKAIANLKPALVILSGNFYRPSGDEPPVQSEAADAIRRAPDGTRVVVFSNTPTAPHDVPTCLASNLTKTTVCEPNPAARWNVALNADLADAARATGAGFVDLQPMLCTATRCPAIAGNILVYRDTSHLTTAFTESRAEDLGMLLEKAVGPIS